MNRLQRRLARLNGWQRLWVFVAVLWGVVVVAVSCLVWPADATGALSADAGTNAPAGQDPARDILTPVKVPDAVKADAWDAFHSSADAGKLEATLKDMALLPNGVMRDLLNAKAEEEIIRPLDLDMNGVPIAPWPRSAPASTPGATGASRDHASLAQLVRARFPGVYDDLDDDTLEQKMLATYPVYADLAKPKNVAAAKAEGDRIRTAAAHAVTMQRLAFLARAFAAWAGPVFALYAFGWGLAWIRRGFTSGGNAASA